MSDILLISTNGTTKYITEREFVEVSKKREWMESVLLSFQWTKNNVKSAKAAKTLFFKANLEQQMQTKFIYTVTKD